MGINSSGYFIHLPVNNICRSQTKLGVYDSRDGTFMTVEIQKNYSFPSLEVYQETLISPILNSNPA
ncbi:hypothetical protein MTR_8g062880 [Medicago truncatula]|uniref:Uncharacterized protein n=1 Tax=Medicago truncatula TaxID=3880 RepID=G7LFD4_MEDTR|nr:hypothetical protein MTR_8g062880 [Medicago truncatula]